MKQQLSGLLLFLGGFCMQSQAQVGIGTTQPQALLHVAEGPVLFSAQGNIPSTPAPVPLTGAGRRMMWYPDKAAFRVGYVETEWNTENIGGYSFASGERTLASGLGATAMGMLTRANGAVSTAMGFETVASGELSTAMGVATIASGRFSTAMGVETTASKEGSIAMGYRTIASGDYSTAMGLETTASQRGSTTMGHQTTASGYYSTAMGYQTTASGFFSTAMGSQTTVSGYYSTAMGLSTSAKSLGSLVIGQYNIIEGNATSWQVTDPLFVAGNGTSATPNNALTLLKNGNLTIAGVLTQNSDARLKDNIHPLPEALNKVLELNGYQYNWNTAYADSNELHTGLLAQEVQKLMPELVKEDATGTLSVNYSGLVPYLIEGVKEQQQAIAEMQELISSQQKLIKKLSERMDEMENTEKILTNKSL